MDLTSTRRAIIDSLAWGWTRKNGDAIGEYLTYLCKIEKTMASNSNFRVQCGLEAGYILAAINSQPPHIAQWLHYCYGPAEEPTRLSDLAQRLRWKLFKAATVKKHKRYISLCTNAVRDYRMREWTAKQLPVVVYCSDMGVSPNHWDRDWKKRMTLCLDLLKDWNISGLSSVSIVVKALNGKLEIDGKPAGPTKALEACKMVLNRVY